MSFEQEIALTREDAWQRYAALTDIDASCEACSAEPRAIYLHGFDLASREAAGRILRIIAEEEGGVTEMYPQGGLHAETVQRIVDEFGLETRGRHRG